ncbi:forkhead box protein M1 isoform X2 [Labeo rohita]|uniref:forkhead box protein M1 isoform X2 n=1 Tax=Labeo rohita TaxID=84645 RepID=UPI0021E32C5B|nr:forkhead box protein M1 isoform X2 [Labeo rohita]
MRESPRRPIILKRRKLPFQKSESDVGCDEADGPRCKTTPTPSTTRCFPDGIRMMDHPTMPDTQVVVIPKAADLQSVISALTAKGKECGPQGRNKFILLSGSTSMEESKTIGCLSTEPKNDLEKVKKETECFPLDDSLTNIQWLGKMSSDGLGSDSNQKCASKDNPTDCPQPKAPEKEKDPQSERPPYSYMAMIQFAINSKKNRHMTLKEIYNWIEDHFPYFRNVAKPGWKNSIRHNLSLHDMFVRETSPDGKISYWTIRPEANRCLTLDQVYKPLVDPVTPTCPQIPQVGFNQQQKRGPPELKKPIPATGSTERKMKPLLPRTDSYLVPIQLPLGQSIFLPTSSPASLATPPQTQSSSTPSSSGASKRVRIAPKVSQSDVSSVVLCASDIKEEPVSMSVSPEAPEPPPPKARRRENSSSRRKQRLVLPAAEEPVLLYPDSTLFDSGVVSDVSTFQDTHDPEPQPSCKADSPNREYTFKTPIKSSHPSSSTPSKLPTVLEPWRITPVGKGAVLDFSPIRTPSGPQLTPQRHEHTPLSFTSTPFKELPLFSSPRELLTCSRPSPRRSTPTCSRELLQAGAANRSLTEGLVLDTMNDSLSKILVDISFPNLEDDELGIANISWSQLIPELK